MSDITVIIPIRNESLHIERSVKSALSLTPNVFVVDSHSTDGSDKIAKQLGAKVYQYDWNEKSNFSKKINWAFIHLPITTSWTIRLDADEYFMNDAIEHLEDDLEELKKTDVNGATLIRRIFFLGRWMKHSNEFPKTSLRVFRTGCVEMENRWLDEHVDIKNGRSINLPYSIVDDNKIPILQWINKHNNDYSNKEAIELINQEIGLFKRIDVYEDLDKNAQKKKNDKNFYSKLPMYWRPFFFFMYRYFIKLGFLDGKEGFLWNFFQCWWYRTLADAKVDEIYAHCGKDKAKIFKYIKDEYHLDVDK